MKTTLTPTTPEKGEFAGHLDLMKVLIEEQAPPEALVEAGARLGDLLCQYDVRDRDPLLYRELRGLIVQVFAIAARALRGNENAPEALVDEIDDALHEADSVLKLAALSEELAA